jgi:hypothetical protein
MIEQAVIRSIDRPGSPGQGPCAASIRAISPAGEQSLPDRLCPAARSNSVAARRSVHRAERAHAPHPTTYLAKKQVPRGPSRASPPLSGSGSAASAPAVRPGRAGGARPRAAAAPRAAAPPPSAAPPPPCPQREPPQRPGPPHGRGGCRHHFRHLPDQRAESADGKGERLGRWSCVWS